jgi:hypothetical protein
LGYTPVRKALVRATNWKTPGKEADVMLQVIPKRWYSPDLSVMEESRPLAAIDASWWREKAVLTIEGRRYRVFREGLMSGAFVLESAGTVLARAEKPSAFRRTLLIHHDGREYTLRATSVLRRHSVLWSGSKQIGSLTPNSIFTRSAAVDLPVEWPAPVRVFIVWLAAIVWMREISFGGA